jgi:tetratricopeptide (TPR) repeat protein
MRRMALIATQDLRRALEVRDTLLQRFADRSESHLIAGHLSKVRGETATAAGSYRRALELDPHQIEALFNLVDLSPPDPLDALTGTLEELRRNPALAARQATNVCFALARIYDRAGETARAFGLFREANAAAGADLRKLGNAYDRRQIERETDEILGMFGPDTFNHPLDPLDLDVKLIFIVGMPLAYEDHLGPLIGGLRTRHE